MNNKMKIHNILAILIIILLFPSIASAYEQHDPIIIRNPIEGNSASNPLIIEGYEISNPGGPCIFVENVDYVVVRDNYLHDCGTDISAEIIENNPRDDDFIGQMKDFMDTGALDLFDIKSGEVYDNKIEHNDYGIRIEGFHNQIQKTHVYDNIIHKNHRSHFLWVKNSNNVRIYGNDVRDNGLGEFFDNEVLGRVLEGEDLGYSGDGRSQGIAVFQCNDVKIYDNYVYNSSSDGIGIMGEGKNPSTNVEIYGNEVVENGEQGIWIAGGHDVMIFKNKVYQSKHRKDETGGSSGIMIETNAVNIDVYENNVYYNDMYGIALTAGTNIDIYKNNITYNGDGGIGIMHLDYIGQEGIENINIYNNSIKNNPKCAIEINNDYFENMIIEDNVFENNGGDPIHHGFYEDHDFSLHLEDWEVEEETVFIVNPESKFSDLVISNNIGYSGDEFVVEKNNLTFPIIFLIAFGIIIGLLIYFLRRRKK
jgi:hypothetical protein